LPTRFGGIIASTHELADGAPPASRNRLVGRSRYRHRLVPALRAAAAHSRHARGGFLLALYFLSQWLQLETVNWVIRNLAAYVVFAIIVLFQSDIRRALAHFGRAPFFRYFERAEQADETIEEIVVAASTLSTRHIGAIVVLERQIGLRNYIEGGIPLDAMFTYDLLASIFQPASPLHDGAVIVQGDRIAAAACFLPLSVNPRVSRDLGTRHRAALGLTEENDAIAVVVSEETGAISLAMGGDLERHLSADGLRTRLHTLLGHRRRRMRRAEEARSSLA
jgi:diadenylate cyclase